jgi:hypothetical protein
MHGIGVQMLRPPDQQRAHELGHELALPWPPQLSTVYLTLLWRRYIRFVAKYISTALNVPSFLYLTLSSRRCRADIINRSKIVWCTRLGRYKSDESDLEEQMAQTGFSPQSRG